nr:ORF0 [Acipenserid herpesvirus 1]
MSDNIIDYVTNTDSWFAAWCLTILFIILFCITIIMMVFLTICTCRKCCNQHKVGLTWV